VTTLETPCCEVCGAEKKTTQAAGLQACPTCRVIISNIKNHPHTIKKLWPELQDEPILPKRDLARIQEEMELPEVLDGKRYMTVDRENNKWYLSVSEVDGQPVEVFASTAFDRDHELQSRISNLTTITRLISLMLRHIFLNEPLTLKKCLKQIKRSSRQKDDLPDMLFGVLSRYTDGSDSEKK
jgi:hypothetical protein